MDVGGEQLPPKLGTEPGRGPLKVLVGQDGGGVERHRSSVTTQFR